MTPSKTEQLRHIRDEVWNLQTSPLYEYRKKNNYYPVLGEGSHDAGIMFVGEAPGLNEARTGRPFCGAAGQILDKLLASVSIPRKSVYVTNIVKDRPPDNRDPFKNEIDTYAPFLMRQITIIQPKLIATLGRFSMDFIMRQFNLGDHITSISRMHGQIFEAQSSFGDIALLPLFHPAVAAYEESKLPILLEDFKAVAPFFLSS